MDPPPPPDPVTDEKVKIVTIITLGFVLFSAVVGITIVAVMTDRDLFRAQTLTFGGFVILALFGGLSWATIQRRRRRHWRIHVDRNGEDEK